MKVFIKDTNKTEFIRLTRNITGHFGNESFRAIDCTGANKQPNSQGIIETTWNINLIPIQTGHN